MKTRMMEVYDYGRNKVTGTQDYESLAQSLDFNVVFVDFDFNTVYVVGRDSGLDPKEVAEKFHGWAL